MPWWSGMVECSICGGRHAAVIEVEEGLDEPIQPMECAACGNMTCYPKEED